MQESLALTSYFGCYYIKSKRKMQEKRVSQETLNGITQDYSSAFATFFGPVNLTTNAATI